MNFQDAERVMDGVSAEEYILLAELISALPIEGRADRLRRLVTLVRGGDVRREKWAAYMRRYRAGRGKR